MNIVINDQLTEFSFHKKSSMMWTSQKLFLCNVAVMYYYFFKSVWKPPALLGCKHHVQIATIYFQTRDDGFNISKI